jgi:hypothetical protein
MILIKKPYFLARKKYIYFFTFCLFTIAFWNSCQSPLEEKIVSPLEKIKDEKVRTLLKKTFKKTGGLENWTNKKSIKFKKYFALFDSLGNTEMSVNQIHEYNSSPNKAINIRWTKENKNHFLQSKNGKITKTINDQPDPTPNPTSLKNTVLSSTFVVNIPFNLLDEGIVLEHQGIDTLNDGAVVEVLRADFNPEAHNNHSTKDTWWYYFDKKEHHLVGYLVKHADHISYVKNLSFTEVDGFTFPVKRKSWRVTKDREILYLRAEYEYSDYEIEK